MKTGLVLEGGALRGLFTAGVLDVFLENELKFSGAVGVSAGACFGVNYKSRQIGRVLRYNLRYLGNPRYASWKAWRQGGNIYGANFCYHILPDKLDPFDKKTFQENPMEFWTVSTDAASGKANYHLLKDCGYADLEWVRASASIPFFARPVAIGGKFYFDGGVSDSIPIKFAQKRYDKNVVITTQPRSYRKKMDKLWPLEKVLLRKYPKILDKIKTRSRDYNQTLDELAKLEAKKEVLVIAPKQAIEISMLEKDQDKIRSVYEMGRAEALARLAEVKSFLA